MQNFWRSHRLKFSLVSRIPVRALLVGSFLNVVIYRLPIMMYREWQTSNARNTAGSRHADAAGKPFNLVVPALRLSGACGTAKIAAWQNIPVISYLLLRGRCAAVACSQSPPRYPLVEFLTAMLSAAVVAWRLGFRSLEALMADRPDVHLGTRSA